MRRRLATVWLAAVLPLVMLEIGLRVTGYGFPSSFFVPLPGGKAYTTNQMFGRRFFAAHLARTPVPDRIAWPKPSGTYRIFILGESAAMGFPEPGFSFGRHLEMMLRRMCPDRRFEVIAASMTAINSHVLAPIARDCARLQPDLFIVYAGNNEVVGPFGAGTVFSRSSGSLGLIRASVWLSGTRTGQWMFSLGRRANQPAEWRGMEMFLGHTVAADDGRLPAVYANFRRNLEQICRIGRDAGAEVIVSTVAVNLKDSPPFQGNGAKLRYQRGQSLLAAGKRDDASREFTAARDLDGLRFRADTRINQTIRETARAAGVRLVDTEQVFGRDGPPGDELFYEHVHLNFAGNDLVARTLVQEVIASLRLPPASVPTPETVWRDLARTAWDDYRVQADIAAMLEHPPFARPASRPRPPGTEVLHQTKLRFTEALTARPDDLRVRQRLADLLASLGELPAAETEWRALLDHLPGVEAWRMALAAVLANENKLDEALAESRRVLDDDPQSAVAQFGLGSVLQRQRRWEEAARSYAAALRLNPRYAEVENNLGLMRMESARDAAGAAAHYRVALRMKEDYPEAHNNLALALSAAGDWDGAIGHYRRAVALNPQLPGAQLNLAGALARRGRAEEAVAVYEEMLRSHPDSFEAHYGLGGLLARAGKMQGAREHLEAAVRLRPAWVEARYDLGSVLSREGALAEAVEQFTAALRLRADYPEAWNNLGAALARRGQTGRAVECFKQALALRPHFAAAQANLAAALR